MVTKGPPSMFLRSSNYVTLVMSHWSPELHTDGHTIDIGMIHCTTILMTSLRTTWVNYVVCYSTYVSELHSISVWYSTLISSKNFPCLLTNLPCLIHSTSATEFHETKCWSTLVCTILNASQLSSIPHNPCLTIILHYLQHLHMTQTPNLLIMLWPIEQLKL